MKKTERGDCGRLRSLLDSALDAIVSADERGTIIDWNPAAERMFGHRRDEVMGKSLELIIPQRFRHAHRAGMSRVGAGGRCPVTGRTVEVSALRKDGSEFPVEMSLGVWEEDGKRFFTGIIRDISARVAAEQELMMAQAKLLESEGLAAASEIIAGVLHEINTPLAALCSMADTATALFARDPLAGDLRNTRRQQLAAQLPAAMAECATRIREVVDALGGLVGLDASEQRVQDMRSAVDAGLMLLSANLQNTSVKRRFEDEPALVRCDASRLNRALATLLKRAAESAVATVDVAVTAAEDEVRVLIHDDGPSLTAEELAEACNPKLRAAHGCMRLELGLASAKRAIEGAGGRLQLVSSPGDGTRVLISLPAASSPCERVAI